MSSLVGLFTTVLTGTSLTVPRGALEVFIKNSGAGAVTVTGNTPNPSTGGASVAVTIAAGEAYSLGYIGKGRDSFVINATASTAQVSISFYV